uniref:Uncharacterized protein n=1 Tax=viral metagenome TaxID=1070528 RepID=A0A6C0BJP1_9ZZZZ
MSQATRLIPLANGFRLPVLLEEADVKQVYDFLACWSIGPLDTTWRTANPLQPEELSWLANGKAFTSERPGDSSRSGFLVVYPPWGSVLYAEADKQSGPNGAKSRYPRVFKVPVRVDPTVFTAGGIIYSATLVGTEKKIIMEDLLFSKGFPTFFKKTFTDRFALLQKSLQNDLFVDEDLAGGLTVSLRSVRPLADLNQFGVWEIIPDEPGKRRWLWFVRRSTALPLIRSSADGKKNPANVMRAKEEIDKLNLGILEPPPLSLASTMVSVIPVIPVQVVRDDKDVAVATKGAFPDQYFLTGPKGEKMGMAIIQNPDISKNLRIKSKLNPQFKVRILASTEFSGSYEILSVL